MIDGAFWILAGLFVAIHAAALAISLARLRKATSREERRQRALDLCLFATSLTLAGVLLLRLRS